jgi:hypothetical protein
VKHIRSGIKLILWWKRKPFPLYKKDVWFWND